MRLPILAAVFVLAPPSLADARPFVAGVGIGRTQAKADADGDASDTAQVFARVGFTRRLAGQVELAKIGDNARTGTALLVVELGSHPRWVPLMSAGIGFDRAQYESGSHIEGGFGLEYRASGGLVIGGEFRLGGRSITSETIIAYDDKAEPGIGVIGFWQPEGLHAGEYRTARVYAAVRF